MFVKVGETKPPYPRVFLDGFDMSDLCYAADSVEGWVDLTIGEPLPAAGEDGNWVHGRFSGKVTFIFPAKVTNYSRVERRGNPVQSRRRGGRR